jgi:hypothetical protein
MKSREIFKKDPFLRETYPLEIAQRFNAGFSMMKMPEVPSGTTGPSRVAGASFVPEGTSVFSSQHFPSVETLGYSQEADGKLVPPSTQRDSLRLAS